MVRKERRAISITKQILALAIIFAGLQVNAYADRGAFSLIPVHLIEDSQKAIILHNFKEEVLILGTELKADQDTEVLEFIPFPSEPQVSLAKGNPFEEVQKLIKIKRIEIKIIYRGGSSSSPVEIRLSEKIGPHDVTVIKINEIDGFSKWVKGFLRGKNINTIDESRLKGFVDIAGDYIKRGINYFVFDYVTVKKEVRFVEPIIYKFTSERLYYPLKTSNIIGGEGKIELILILPGSLCVEIFWEDQACSNLWNTIDADLSSSSKVYLEELKSIYEHADEFFRNIKRIYLQAIIYNGDYKFEEDLNLDISKIAPYARKFEPYLGLFQDYYWEDYWDLYFKQFTPDELDDLFEAHPDLRKKKIIR